MHKMIEDKEAEIKRWEEKKAAEVATKPDIAEPLSAEPASDPAEQTETAAAA
jgi:hypothetical protein